MGICVGKEKRNVAVERERERAELAVCNENGGF